MRLAIIIMAVLLIPLAISEPTQQFNKLYLNPFYRVSMLANTNYTYSVDITPPDGIKSIHSALISFEVWMSPTVTYTLFVNGQYCNNPTYVISTTYSGAGLSRPIFDCSNIIKSSGTYTINLKSSNPSGSVTGWIDLSYVNSPQTSIKITATDYEPDEHPLISADFTDPLGVCEVTVPYANISSSGQTIMFNKPMFFWSDKNQFIYNANNDGYTLPDDYGVHPVYVECISPTNETSFITYLGRTNGENTLRNASISFTDSILVSGGTEVCFSDEWEDRPVDFGQIRNIHNATDIDVHIKRSGGSSSNKITMNFTYQNFDTNAVTLINKSINSSVTITTSNTHIKLPDTVVNQALTSKEKLLVSLCIYNDGGGATYTLNYTDSKFTRGTHVINSSVSLLSHGSSELVINPKSAKETNISELSNSINGSFAYTNSRVDFWGSLLNTTINLLFPKLDENKETIRIANESIHLKLGSLTVLVNGSVNITQDAINNFWLAQNRTIDTGGDLAFASKTEYKLGEPVKIKVQFTRVTAGITTALNGGSCAFNITDMNDAQVFNVTGSYVAGSNGLYTATVTPNSYGVFTVDARCVQGGNNGVASQTFHVAQWIDSIISAVGSANNTLALQLAELNSSLRLAILDTEGKIIGNISVVNGNIVIANQTIQASISSLGNNLTLARSSIEQKLNDLNIWLSGNVSFVLSDISAFRSSLSSDIKSNFTYTNDLIFNISNRTQQNFTVDLSPVTNRLVSLDTALYGNFTATNSLIIAIPSGVWSFNNRSANLTQEQENALIAFIALVNSTIGSNVWNYPGVRNVDNVSFTNFITNTTNLLTAFNITDEDVSRIALATVLTSVEEAPAIKEAVDGPTGGIITQGNALIALIAIIIFVAVSRARRLV